ncbi:AraC family transcriptional regulator [Streptococcus merionis]|uniref:AraC family transcriptional regulator n=1 Tax=Streptococcus merionis TaxID=400065 RepID=A0A239T287_9STRE|nr:AraC family transcriptional regulator [Streptococcus merionis]SNU91064.1 AraC family transcriptional regulator [Streptococcus merionis]
MNNLDQLLFAHTEHERAQLQKHDFIADFPELKTYSGSQIPVISQQIFGNNKDVYISKHSRFAAYPTHSHQFLEINYVYHGECRQTINGHDYHFQAGDIILMDSESTQSIQALGEEDILINILFRNKDISLDWLNQLQSHNSVIYNLLLNATLDHRQQANFAIFPKEKTGAVLPVLHQLLTEYFFPNDFSDKMIEHYLSILMYHLARTLSQVNQEAILAKSNDPYAKLLDLIEQEFATLTLAQAADKLNFNKNYLSNLVKTRSGQTFTQLLHQKRLSHAKLLITSTELPIQEIAQMTGFSNRTFFYQKYQETYGCKPADSRKKTQSK